MWVHHHRGDSAYNFQERFVVKFRDTQNQTSQYNTSLEVGASFSNCTCIFKKIVPFKMFIY